MKWWHWLVLELLIIFGVISWIYFFPGEIEDDFAKSLIGFVLIYAVDKYRETNWRNNKMSENYTVEQNAGENQIEGGVASISGSVEKHYRPFKDCDELVVAYHKRAFTPILAEELNKNLKKMYRPEIWVKSKEYGTDNLITAFDNDNESIGGSCVFIQDNWVDMKELFDNFTFLDGSPCGMEK